MSIDPVRGEAGPSGGSGDPEERIDHGDLQKCLEVMNLLFRDRERRAAWLLGFLAGSALSES
jgi:hypothetical protein